MGKRSGRNKPIWVVIHKCMGAMLGISLYSYLYPKLAKTFCLSYYLLCFLLNKIEISPAQKWAGGQQVAQAMHTHGSKCKNDKRKKKAGKDKGTLYTLELAEAMQLC
jgi:hypothetical protein